MRYLRGWDAIRSDPDGTNKVLMASLLVFCGLIVPIVGPILLQMVLLGWNAIMLRRAVSGQDAPLPKIDFDFDYLGKLMQHGFKAWLARMIWSLPIMLFAMVSMCCLYVTIGGAMMSLTVGAATGDELGAGLGGIGGMCMMFAFVVLYPICMFGMQMPLHVAVTRAEITDDVNQAMRFKDVLSMTKLLVKELLVGQIVMALIGFPLVLIGELMCLVGIFPAVVVLNVLMTYWHAELYRVYLEKGGEPLPVGALTVEGGDVPEIAPQQDGWNRPQQF